MAEKKQYWPDELHVENSTSVFFELRTAVALKLVEHFAVVAAKIDGEDKAGRSKLELQTPKELVQRAFDISDAFVEMAEDRGELHQDTISKEEKVREVARLARISRMVEFEMDEEGRKAREERRASEKGVKA